MPACVVDDRFGLQRHAAGAFEHVLPERGRKSLLAQSLQKANAQPFLEFTNLHADSRLRKVEALLGTSRTSRAQAYPARPVRLVVAGAPGGVTDITARLIGEALAVRIGQPLVFDDRPGAGGSIATEAVVRAPADRCTLLMATTANAIDATLRDKLSYNFMRDIAPVASLTQSPNVLVVHPSHPARTVPEFITYARAHPDKINVASAGNGTSQHVAAELFNMMARVEMHHVPYRGSPQALTDLLGS